MHFAFWWCAVWQVDIIIISFPAGGEAIVLLAWIRIVALHIWYYERIGLYSDLMPSLKYIKNVRGTYIHLCFRNFTQHKSQFEYERGSQVCTPKTKTSLATQLAFIFGVQTWYRRSYLLLAVLMVRTARATTVQKHGEWVISHSTEPQKTHHRNRQHTTGIDNDCNSR